MDTTSEVRTEKPAYRSDMAIKAVTAGSAAATLLGIAAAVLAIVGLAWLTSYSQVATATVIVGIAFLLGAASIVARLKDLTGTYARGRIRSFDSGMAAEFVGGLSGLILGILALFGVAPASMIGVAVIIFGCTLMISAAKVARLNWLPETQGVTADTHPFARDMVRTSAAIQTVIGLGAIVLGILALAGVVPLVLCLTAMLIVSCALLLTGTSLCSRMFGIAH